MRPSDVYREEIGYAKSFHFRQGSYAPPPLLLYCFIRFSNTILLTALGWGLFLLKDDVGLAGIPFQEPLLRFP